MYLLYIGLPIAVVLSFIFYFTQRDTQAEEKPKYFIVVSIIATVVGLLWTYVVSDMLIDLLNAYIIVFQLDYTFMG